jgi:thymidylate synthase ThyX
LKGARTLATLGVHKQLANRLLEPFLWHTVIVSATEWSNFFALRCHPDAQPEIRKIAEMMRDAMKASEPTPIPMWHLPLVDDAEQLHAEGFHGREVALISAGRCARVSYLTHDGKRDPHADMALAKRLLASGHMSPFEHQAYPMMTDAFDARRRFRGNFRGWVQLRKTIDNEDDFSMVLAARGQEGGE